MPMPARGGGGRLKPIDFEMPQEPEFSRADDATRRHPTTSSAPRRPEVRARVLTPLGALPPVTVLTSIAANGDHGISDHPGHDLGADPPAHAA
jgi:hypothetical protein